MSGVEPEAKDPQQNRPHGEPLDNEEFQIAHRSSCQGAEHQDRENQKKDSLFTPEVQLLACHEENGVAPGGPSAGRVLLERKFMRRSRVEPERAPATTGYERRALIEDIPASPLASEKAVDERSERRTLCCDKNRPQREQEDHDGEEPPFLAKSQKIPKLFENRQLVHGVS